MTTTKPTRRDDELSRREFLEGTGAALVVAAVPSGGTAPPVVAAEHV